MKLLINTLLLLTVTAIYSQNTIQGIVTDAYTNDTLSLVNVYFSDLEKGTSTNDFGIFNIQNISSGKHNIVFSMMGYETLVLILN